MLWSYQFPGYQICNNVDNSTFPGTALANCAALAPDMKACQAVGKILTLSLGGAGGGVSFASDTDAQALADFIWNSFLGGTSTVRPFGDVVLDGSVGVVRELNRKAHTPSYSVDLDIESGGSTGYVAFVNRIRSYAAGAPKP
jgi:chitinase